MSEKRVKPGVGATKVGSNGTATPDTVATESESVTHRLRYQEFFEFAPDCHFVTDAAGVILEANLAAAVLFACRKEFLVGKPLGLLVIGGHRSRFYESLTRLKTDDSDTFETRVGRRGGARDVAARVFSRDDGNGRRTFHWMISDITEQRRAETARRNLVNQIVAAQEDERRRIARELHDEMGQHLTALILDLKLLSDTFTPGSPACEQLDQVRRAAGHIGHAIHRLALELRPTALDDLGLEMTLRNYLADWSRRTGIEAGYRLVGSGRATAVPSHIETTVFRIAQESLTNVAKHAKATLVSVILERKENSLRLIIEDNGSGFDVDAVMNGRSPETRLGLLGMKERVAILDGSLVIESEPGSSTSIYVDVPFYKNGDRSTHG
jgi:PAS domain S-box-containing protein